MTNDNQLKNKRWVQKDTNEGFCIANPKNKVTQLSDNVCVNGIYYGKKENVTNNKQNHFVDFNNMVSSIDKEFVPYEQALELKELGFDEHCFGFYNICGFNINTHIKNSDDLISIEFERLKYHLCTTPTFSQAFRWFRENHDLFIAIVHYVNGYSINDLRRFDTYEEAELECLRKLIEIVKEKQQ